MPRQDSLTNEAVEVLGEVDIAGRTARITWPRIGDAVGIDFTDPRRRYGVVVGLDSDPRLLVEPRHASILEVEERLLVLEQVGALWYRVVPRGWISGTGA